MPLLGNVANEYHRETYDRFSNPELQNAHCYNTGNLGTDGIYGGLSMTQNVAYDPVVQARWFNLTPGTTYTLVLTSNGNQIGPSFTAASTGVGLFQKASVSDISLPTDIGSEICLNDGSSNVLCCNIAADFGLVSLNSMNQTADVSLGPLTPE